MVSMNVVSNTQVSNELVANQQVL